MRIQDIEHINEDGNLFVKMSEESFNDIIERLEDLEDINSIKEAQESNEETFPMGFTMSISEAETSGKLIELWREYRGFSKVDLGNKINVSGQYIGMIESGKRTGDISIYKNLADALRCDIEDMLR